MQGNLFDVYDSVGGATVDTATTIAFNETRFLADGVSLSSGEILVKLPVSRIIPPENYLILLLVKVSLDNNRTQSKVWLEANDGSGFLTIPGTVGNISNRANGSGWGSLSLNSTYKIEKMGLQSVIFRVRAQKTDGTSTVTTLQDASNFIGIIYL